MACNFNQLHANKPSTFGTIINAEIQVFKNYCTKLFGDINGLVVYDFYKKAMRPISGSNKPQAEKQKEHLNSLLTIAHNDQVIILEAFSKLADKFNDSTVPERFTENYVKGAVRLRASGEVSYKKINAYSKPKTVNKKAATKESTKNITTTSTIEPEHITPERNELIRPDSEVELYKYNYKCSCGTVVTWHDNKCPTCSNTFDWMLYV